MCIDFKKKAKDMDANLYLADYYFALLNSLSNRAKLFLVKRLTDSMLKNEAQTEALAEKEKDAIFHRLAGAWSDDPEANTMASIIRDGRTSSHTRQLASFDE